MAEKEEKTKPEPASEAPEAKAAKKKEKKKEEKKEKKGLEVKKGDFGPDFRYIVRIANTDLDGTKTFQTALTGVKGVGPRVAQMVAVQANLDLRRRMGDLKDEEIERVAKAVEGVHGFAPMWAVNRQRDIDTGDDHHVVGVAVATSLRDDLNRLKKIRSYRGLRHEAGLPVRGQRTRANGRTGLTVGVQRSKAQADAKAAAAGGEKKEEAKA